MVLYNLSNYTGANNFFDLAVAADSLASGYLFVLFLVLILIISFVSMKRFPAKQALISSSFISFVLSSILWVLGLVGEGVAIVFTVLFVFAVAAGLLLD